MLNKTDLSQIRGIIREEIQEQTPKIVQRENTSIKNDLKTIKKDVAKTRKDIDVIISLFDREYVELRKRVDRIEEHLNLSPFSGKN